MSDYESLAWVILHEAEEAAERDARRMGERGIATEPWTAERLLSMAGVFAPLAGATRPAPRATTGPRRRWTPRRMRLSVRSAIDQRSG